MNFNHPFWLAGFRSLFALAMLAGAALPPLWIALLSGMVALPATLARPPTTWHAHEMLYGFGWAMLAGFLLTATKNWVGVRGWHGGALALLAALWVLERIAMAAGAAWPSWLFAPAAGAFLVVAVGLIMHTLLRNRAKDSYRGDNGYFYLALPLFLLAKALLLTPDTFPAGVAMTIALFRIAFLLMLERTLAAFMNGAFKIALPRFPLLDHVIKVAALILVASPWLPAAVAGLIAALLALLLLARWCLWSPWKALSRLDIGIMYLGMLAMAVHAGLLAMDVYWPQAWIGQVATHIFTLGVMGAIVPAMIVRIAKGHTGRKVAFDASDKAVLVLMLIALAARAILTLAAPPAYMAWLWLAAMAWTLGFGLLAWRYIPLLVAPRIDGREH